MTDDRSAVPPPAGPPPAGPPPAQPEKDGGDRAAFLPIGFVFVVVGIGGLLNDSLRYGAVAFLTLGFVFVGMGLQARAAARDAAAPAVEDDPGDDPDVRRP